MLKFPVGVHVKMNKETKEKLIKLSKGYGLSSFLRQTVIAEYIKNHKND